MGSKVLPSFIYESTVAWRIFENCLFRRANRRRKSAADSWQQVVVTYFQIFPALLFFFFFFLMSLKTFLKMEKWKKTASVSLSLSDCHCLENQHFMEDSQLIDFCDTVLHLCISFEFVIAVCENFTLANPS